MWDQPAAMVPHSYVRALQRAGAAALILPPDAEVAADPAAADDLLELLDGLMLAGGSDIDPDSYGAPRHPMTIGTDRGRDGFEIALAGRALERDLPVLGICRGMQLLNIARGGTLIQDLPERLGHGDHRRVTGSFDGSDHIVRLAAGSLAASAAGETRHGVKSHHHQGVERVGEGFAVSGWSELDELPEAIEAPERQFVLGVQWHPEADRRSRVIAALVSAARDYRTASGSA